MEFISCRAFVTTRHIFEGFNDVNIAAENGTLSNRLLGHFLFHVLGEELVFFVEGHEAFLQARSLDRKRVHAEDLDEDAKMTFYVDQRELFESSLILAAIDQRFTISDSPRPTPWRSGCGRCRSCCSRRSSWWPSP